MINYSIIIPHKDIPDLLQRCLDSIPVREDVQVIVVDDNSNVEKVDFDHFPQWRGKYYETYFTKQGRGAGYARNVGIEYAKGTWILFADADDFFMPKMLDILDTHLEDIQDVIYFKAKSVDTETLLPANRHIERNASIDAYFHGDVTDKEAALWFTVVWSQMLSRKFIMNNSIKCDEIVCANDVMFAAKVACLATSIGFSNEELYVITERKNSLHDSKSHNVDRYLVQQQANLHLDRYKRTFNITNTDKPCMLKVIQDVYSTYGIKKGMIALKMVLHEHALFYGLLDYIKRHLI